MPQSTAGTDYFVSILRYSSVYPNQYSGVETLVYNQYGAAAQMEENRNRNLQARGFINLCVEERNV